MFSHENYSSFGNQLLDLENSHSHTRDSRSRDSRVEAERNYFSHQNQVLPPRTMLLNEHMALFLGGYAATLSFFFPPLRKKAQGPEFTKIN